MGMVEKVARRLCEAADDDWDWSVFYIVDANDTAETGRDVYRDMARAALEAMREPDDEMVKAGVEFSLSATVSGDGGWPRYVADKHRAMIDKALESGG